MHVISLKKLREFWLQHPDSEEPLRRWYKITTKAAWEVWRTRGVIFLTRIWLACVQFLTSKGIRTG